MLSRLGLPRHGRVLGPNCPRCVLSRQPAWQSDDERQISSPVNHTARHFRFEFTGCLLVLRNRKDTTPQVLERVLAGVGVHRRALGRRCFGWEMQHQTLVESVIIYLFKITCVIHLSSLSSPTSSRQHPKNKTRRSRQTSGRNRKSQQS